MASQPPLLDVRDLSVWFPSEAGRVAAVRTVSYQVQPGEVLGIVGESGSGKTVSSLAVMNLLPPQAAVTGSVRFQGQELVGQSDAALSEIRGRRLAMVFQDPLSALTPVYTVGDQIAEAVLVHERVTPAAARARAVELLDLVGIPRAAERAAAFPHEFSGGMRQRVMIAWAIANQPALIIADEPTTALDVTVQAEVLDVLRDLQTRTGLGVILVTHNLGVVADVCDRVAVMQNGRLVEQGEVRSILRTPQHPYTRMLLSSMLEGKTPMTPLLTPAGVDTEPAR